MLPLFVKRFDDLIEQARHIESKKFLEAELHGNPREQVGRNVLLNWKVKAKNLLIQTCGDNSTHVNEFVEAESGTFSTSLNNLHRMLAVFTAAKDDYAGGYLDSIKSLVQAELFSNELEQAEQLHKGGFIRASAIVIGIVLENTLRELCQRNSVAAGKLSKMNEDLAKAGIYTAIRKKQLESFIAMRNNAAHDETLIFLARDVGTMLQGTQAFMADVL